MDKEITRTIQRAKRHGITLAEADFRLIDGEPTLDGMSPDEWIDAMTLD